MQQICPNCRAEVTEGKKFCHNCGSKIESAPQQFEIPPVAPPTQQLNDSPPPPDPPAAQLRVPPPAYAPMGLAAQKNNAAPMGMLAYLGWLALMCVPVVGWVASAVASFAGTNATRKNLARAMLALTGIGIALAATLTIIYWEFIKDLKWLIEENFEITFGFFK